MEEEDEQEDQEEVEVEEQPPSPSDLGGVPWKEAVELHAKLRGDHCEEGEGEALADTGSRDGEVDEEDEEEDDEEDEDEAEEDEESSEGKLVLHWFSCDSGNEQFLYANVFTSYPDFSGLARTPQVSVLFTVSCVSSLSETLSHPLVLVSFLLVCHVHVRSTCMYLSLCYFIFLFILGGFVSPC